MAPEDQLKQLKVEKGIISGKFKHLQKNSPEYEQQMELMKAISQQIKLLESAAKQEKNPSGTTSSAAAPSIPFFNLNPDKQWRDLFNLELVELVNAIDWPEFVTQHPAQLPSHNPAWAEVIQQSFGHSSYVLLARSPTREIIGGIPFTVFESPLFGKFGVSMPHLNYGGVVSEYFNIHQALMLELEQVRTQLQLKYLEVRSIYPDLGPNPSTKKVSMVLELPATDEQLEKQLGSKLRAQYKKAEESAPETRIGRLELLDDFYKVFATNMRDLGTPVYAKQWFNQLLAHKNLNCQLIIIYVNRKPVSAGFLVNHGKLMEIPWASTLKSANKLNTNMWMYRQILTFAIAQKCEFFDFGRSTVDAGTYKFKKQWGAIPYQHYWYSIVPKGAAKPEMNPDNPKLQLVIALWKLLPVWVTKIIGPRIVKDIP